MGIISFFFQIAAEDETDDNKSEQARLLGNQVRYGDIVQVVLLHYLVLCGDITHVIYYQVRYGDKILVHVSHLLQSPSW